ncbi:CsbD family protein [Roseomonas sp. OT10]|uniref:CsbD family protein n=1 Tax=Roseomonas cutis TaxID=2897332 RepID=UPI001E293BAB|nr:CsbD family protein [Roseomonas sp. OT10]UFN50583.1 CsbD family protein [Roseomonas sp. OT10]
MSGKVREEWGNLTEQEVAGIKGDRTALLSLIRERYGFGEEEAERRLRDWEHRLGG